MRIIYFDNLEYNSEWADLVMCTSYDEGKKADAMLVPSGNEFCPICGNPTSWKDEERNTYELNISEAFAEHEIVHMKAKYREEYNSDLEESVLIEI